MSSRSLHWFPMYVCERMRNLRLQVFPVKSPHSLRFILRGTWTKTIGQTDISLVLSRLWAPAGGMVVTPGPGRPGRVQYWRTGTWQQCTRSRTCPTPGGNAHRAPFMTCDLHQQRRTCSCNLYPHQHRQCKLHLCSTCSTKEHVKYKTRKKNQQDTQTK